jgi:type II secretory pathway pseudopilin PulG
MTTVGTTHDRGETLIELVLTVVIISVAVTALVSGLATAANAAGAQRESVLADTTLRNLAEAAKAEVRVCVPGDDFRLDQPLPDRWSSTTTPDRPRCPAPGDTVRLTLTVQSPAGRTWPMDVIVRSP